MTTYLHPRAAWALVLVATSTMAVSYIDRQAVAALAPSITAELKISDAAFGWLGSAFSVAYLVGAPIAGRLIDRVGARRGLRVSLLLWSVIAALHALVPGFAVLFLLRILLGLAEAPSFPGAAQTVSRALPPESRSAAFGVLFTGSSIGAALSAVIAPTLAAAWGWRWALVGTAVSGLLWLPLWWAVTRSPATRRLLEPQVDGPSQAAASASDRRWSTLLGRPALWRALAAVVASAPIVGLVLQFGAKVLVTAHGVSQTDVRAYLWLPPLAFDGGAILFGALGSFRLRRSPAAARGAPAKGLFAISALLCLAVGLISLAETPWQTTIAAAIALAGGGGVYALATSDMLSRIPASQVASASGMTAAAQSLALIIAFPLIGAVVQASGSYDGVAIGLALWMLPGALFWLAVPGAPSKGPGAAEG